MNEELIVQIENENRLLELLKIRFLEYKELLDAFKFEKMKYVRAQDKFEAAIRAYEEVDKNDTEGLKQAEANYLKWKEMAGRNYDSCQELKIKGEGVLGEVNDLRKQLDIKSGADLIEAVIESRIAENKIKIGVLK